MHFECMADTVTVCCSDADVVATVTACYLLQFIDDVLAPLLHDRMTQCRYDCPPETFSLVSCSQPVHYIDVVGEGRSALARANTELGLLM